MSHKEVRFIKQSSKGKVDDHRRLLPLYRGRTFLPTTISPASMANLPTTTDASAFKLFGKVIQPDASNSNSTGESTAPPPAPPPPPPAPAPPSTAPPAVGGEPLPCPRCGSRETKFCYFNNYNVRQPRHLCRACRRYWTAGGALRRVATASPGRRRPRPSARSVAAAASATASTSEQGAAESVDSRS